MGKVRPKFIQVAVPEDFHMALKVWAAQNNSDFGEIGREALEAWAKAKGVTLPKYLTLRDTKAEYKAVSAG